MKIRNLYFVSENERTQFPLSAVADEFEVVRLRYPVEDPQWFDWERPACFICETSSVRFASAVLEQLRHAWISIPSVLYSTGSDSQIGRNSFAAVARVYYRDSGSNSSAHYFDSQDDDFDDFDSDLRDFDSDLRDIDTYQPGSDSYEPDSDFDLPDFDPAEMREEPNGGPNSGSSNLKAANRRVQQDLQPSTSHPRRGKRLSHQDPADPSPFQSTTGHDHAEIDEAEVDQAEVDQTVQAGNVGGSSFLEGTPHDESLRDDPFLTAGDLIAELLSLVEADMTGSPSPFELRKRLGRLSNQERVVLNLSLQGQTSREIAALLEIRSQTVDKYRRNALQRMRANNLVELLRQLYESLYRDWEPSLFN